MNLVSQYVIKVGAYVLFALVLEGILPQGSSKKIVKLMLSLLFLYVLMGPVISWLQQEIPLEQLTTVDFSWEEAEQQAADYEQQAASMVNQGWQAAMQQSLPQELEEEYTIVEVEMDEEKEKVQVSLARSSEIGSFSDRSLNLGTIGISSAEEERVKNSLCQSWGIEPEQLEMKLR